MSEDKKLRTFDDLLRVVRALAYEFETDTVFVVGSQAILASMPDAPEAASAPPEIDAFPQNAKVWAVTEAKRTRDADMAASSGKTKIRYAEFNRMEERLRKLSEEELDGMVGRIAIAPSIEEALASPVRKKFE
jgi:hypothetical protein